VESFRFFGGRIALELQAAPEFNAIAATGPPCVVTPIAPSVFLLDDRLRERDPFPLKNKFSMIINYN